MGLAVGIAIIYLSMIIIFESEGDKTPQTYALRLVREKLIKVSNSSINSKNNLQVVYISGLATSGEVLKDPLLHVSQQAIKLIRKVEMYQWVEQVSSSKVLRSVDEKTVYRYTPQWSETLINSHLFNNPQGHQNPETMLMTSLSERAQSVRVGDFHLPSELVENMKGAIILDLAQIDLSTLQEKLHRTILHKEYSLYVGQDPQKPQIGDLRITMMEVVPQTVSIIAQQFGLGLRPYKTVSGESISLLVMGSHSPKEMLKEANTDTISQFNSALTRFVTFAMMVLGIYLILWPVAALAKVMPYLGKLVKKDRVYMAFIGGLLLWALVTSIAWCTYRPFWALGIILLALLVCCIMLAIRSSSLD